MRKIKILSIIAVVVMLLATWVRFSVGLFDPFTETPEPVWSNGLITKMLSFQHPTATLTGDYPVSDPADADDPSSAMLGAFLWVITIVCVVKSNEKRWYANRWMYIIGLLLLTTMRLGYWIPYLLH